MIDAKTRIAAFDRATFELVHAEHGIEWRPHGFRGPIKYALLTCAQCDRSLVIVDDGEEGRPMDNDVAAVIAEEHAPTGPTEPEQPVLVPMTEEELREAGRLLAHLVQELAQMTAAHALQRTEQATERKELRERIENVAQTIRQQGR